MNEPQRYDSRRTYQWNYDNAPQPSGLSTSREAANHRFLGLACRSPLGVAAGPLLNSDWILHYAELGYDILTYKTVRSRQRDCYPMPNLLPVQAGQLAAAAQVQADSEMRGSWAISFGMPSQDPSVWMPDVRRAREMLSRDKLLSVSVVATPEPDWSLQQVADDYAAVAMQAAESGADSIEANFSCPNVSSADGQLFQDARSAQVVAKAIRDAIGKLPLVLKIGHVTDVDSAKRLLDATAESITGLAMINCIPATVRDAHGCMAFDGQRRGIGGVAIRDAVRRQVEMFVPLAQGQAVEIIGVGGVSTKADYRTLIDLGVCSVQVATAAMIDPSLPENILLAAGPEHPSRFT